MKAWVAAALALAMAFDVCAQDAATAAPPTRAQLEAERDALPASIEARQQRIRKLEEERQRLLDQRELKLQYMLRIVDTIRGAWERPDALPQDVTCPVRV